MHVDLEKTNSLKAAIDVRSWVGQNHIKVLNVAGPRGSKDSGIYETTQKLLKGALQLDPIQSTMPDPRREAPHWPATLEEAVNEIISKLTMKDKTLIEKLSEDALTGLHVNLEMVRARYAEVYRRTLAAGLDSTPYWKAEEEARTANKGMWAQGDKYVSPRESRKVNDGK